MQLSLPFEYEELKRTPLTKEDFSHISEFEQGNFTSAICSRFTADEIAKILLKSESALPTLKESILKQRGLCATRLDQDINESYKDHIRIHNDSVRTALKISYAGKTKKRLKKNGFDKFRKYNNAYRDFYGGQSSSKLSVTDENHEWYDKYLKEEEAYLKETISMLYNSNISDRDEFHTYYMKIYNEDAYKDARDEYFRSTIEEAIKSENLVSLHNLYTKAFGERYCADALDGMQITEKEKSYLLSLWQIPIGIPLDTKDKEKIKESTSQRVFKDPTTSLLYVNIDKLDEVHIQYIYTLKKGYWESIISMDLSEEKLSTIFKWFLRYIMAKNAREKAVDLFSYCVDAFGREEINNLLFRNLQKSEDPLSNEEIDIVYKLAHAYLRRSS